MATMASRYASTFELEMFFNGQGGNQQ